MLARQRITQAAYDAVANESLVFFRDTQALSEKECRRQSTELVDAWRQEYRRRIQTMVQRIAPEKASIYLPASAGR
jgi:hypothetical protein